MLNTSEKVFRLGAACALTLAVTTPALQADCEATESDQVTASDGVSGMLFGKATAIDGNRMIVGAPDADGLSGSVYVYEFDGQSWNEYPKLIASDTQSGDKCGYSVAIDGDVAVVGAPYHMHPPTYDGAVYVFRLDGGIWTQEQEVLAPQPSSAQSLGWSVAIQGDVIVAGANFDTSNGAGSVYVYRYDGSTWTYEDVVTATAPQPFDYFGHSVDIDGQVILVGAPGENSNTGAAYFFTWQGGEFDPWGGGARITGSDIWNGDNFGFSVAISGDASIVAANTWDGNPDTGSAYLLRFNGADWVEEQKLTVPAGTPEPSEFGYSVALEGDVALIGAPYDDAATNDTGSAYVYAFDGAAWSEQAKLAAENGAAGDLLGWSVSLSGDKATAGALGVLSHVEAAYTYDGLSNGMPDQCEASSCPWDLGGDGSVGITDFLDLLAAWGSDPGGPPDFDGDQNVGIGDFLTLLANWGACP